MGIKLRPVEVRGPDGGRITGLVCPHCAEPLTHIVEADIGYRGNVAPVELVDGQVRLPFACGDGTWEHDHYRCQECDGYLDLWEVLTTGAMTWTL